MANTCRVPESLERTNQPAPGPIWQSTQRTRAWGEFWCAVSSGCMTAWQVFPQNSTESMNSIAPDAATARSTRFTTVMARKRTNRLRIRGRLKSRTGNSGSPGESGCFFCRHRLTGMSTSPSRNPPGRTRNVTMPKYGFPRIPAMLIPIRMSMRRPESVVRATPHSPIGWRMVAAK